MAQVKFDSLNLNFASPKVLNNLQQGQFTDKVAWHYHNLSDSVLTLNAENWTIECPANGKSAKITDWVVDEDSFQFAVKGEEGADSYAKIEYPFAVAMLGQLISHTDLVRYLMSLQKAFGSIQGGDNFGNSNGSPSKLQE